jgi:hypothetical protein
MMKALALMLLASLAFAACGSDGDTEPAGSAAPGPGISIEEALAADADEPLLVNGNLLVEGDDVRFCSALAESFPPQCGGASLRVEGLDLGQLEGLTSARDVTWTDRPIQLLGTVGDGVLTVAGNARR